MYIVRLCLYVEHVIMDTITNMYIYTHIQTIISKHTHTPTYKHLATHPHPPPTHLHPHTHTPTHPHTPRKKRWHVWCV